MSESDQTKRQRGRPKFSTNKSATVTSEVNLMAVGDHLSLTSLITLNLEASDQISEGKRKLASSLRSAAYRANEAHPAREYEVFTSANVHTSNRVLVVATVTRLK